MKLIQIKIKEQRGKNKKVEKNKIKRMKYCKRKIEGKNKNITKQEKVI